MNHKENFELEEEYYQLWQKLKILQQKRLEPLFIKIEEEIQEKSIIEIVQKIFLKSTLYFANDAYDIVSLCNDKYKNVYELKECIHELKYLGETNDYFSKGQIYKSSYFTGAVYTIKVKGIDKKIGLSYFQRIS